MRLNQQRDLAVAKTVSYQKLLDRIPHLAWLMTDDGEIVAVNQQWGDYIGQIAGVDTAAPTEDEGQSWLFGEILHEDERESFVRAWAQARGLNTALNLKLQFQSRQGNWEWFEVELDPDRSRSGQTIWICTAIRLGGEARIPSQKQLPKADRQGSTAQFLAALLANASDGIVACDADGNLVLFNLAAQMFHGLPPEPIEPEDWAKYYDLYDRDGVRNLTKLEVPLFRALQGEAVVSQEMMIKSKRGGDRSLLANSTAIYSPTGEKMGAVVLMKDITAYKQAEIERLRIQLYNEQLSSAMRVGKAGAWTWDLHTKKTFWTPEFEVLFDYEPGSTEQVYSEWLDRLHPDDLERVETTLQQAIDGVLPEYRCEYRIVLRNGDIRWIDVVGELHADEQGNPTSMSGLVYDITDRKRDEEALRQSEEFTRRVLESNQDCIKVLDLEGRVLYMNDGGQLLMEIDNFNTVANTKWVEFWQDDETEYPVNAFTTAKAGETAKFEGYCNTVKGTPKYWDVVMTPMLDVDGKVDRILSVSRDVTDRKQWELTIQTQAADLQRLNNSLMLAQQKLQERNVELDRFVAIAAHDLKAPLRAIANLSTWIEEDLQAQIPGENPQLKLLRQRVKRMDALIDGLLRYSRAGREHLATETVDVAQVLAETIDSLSPPSCFQIQIDGNMPILNTKRLLLSQVFANLISNAIKHHDRVDGRVEITVEDLGDCDRFSIADDGPGIPPGESRDRIFEIFQTLNSATDSTENTGIGLALVKKIVEGEGGELWLDRECTQGCRFCFTWLKTAMPSQHRY
jgi:PAS domain S-box-containing protein